LLLAYDMKADIVAVVDDDNIPNGHWGKNVAVGTEVEVTYYTTDLPAFDPVGATNYPQLWHRGYPLQLLAKRDYSKHERRRVRVDVQADFWDGDPDIDAICRMEHAPACSFDASCFPIAANVMAPFNSQNTFLAGHLLKDYFQWPLIGRMDDIWAAYYLQALGASVIFGPATVFQDRNVHDLTRDLVNEFLGYQYNLKLVQDLAKDAGAISAYLPGPAIWAWELYERHFT